ncbi:MAG: hypothetical protein LBU22_14465 [Dysgonamonadaceae bacterium]|jgi:hypothetical protein|nr:hypothetical protein [Dysgonamonadaceae bacterium]
MTKKKLILLFFGLVGMNVFLFAQQDDKRKQEFEQFKEKRVAFITKAMNLNNEDAKDFWPLCDELQGKKFELNRIVRKAMYEYNQAKKEGKHYAESEYKKLIELCADSKQKEVQLEYEYYTVKFPKVISAEKIFLYIQAEQQFARQILEQRERSKEQKSDDGNRSPSGNKPDNRRNSDSKNKR